MTPGPYGGFASQAELDAEYDVERSVADFGVYAEHYVQASEAARRQLDAELDLPYGPTLDEHLDWFAAKGNDRPVLLFIHGGYWRMLSSKEFSCVALGPTAAGIHLLNINYSLAPRVSLDEIVRQIRAAVAWAYHNAANFGGDRERIYISGHSAGGHLSAMALATDWTGDYGLPPDVLKGAFMISGLYDLHPLRYSFVQPALQLSGDQVERLSPLFKIPELRAEIVVTVGGDEPSEFQRQSRDYLSAWQRAGNRGEFFAQPGKNHFDAIDGFEDADSALCHALCQLMRIDVNQQQRAAQRFSYVRPRH